MAKLTRRRVDREARLLYEHVHPPGKPLATPWPNTGKDCRAFYRKIARWHLGRVAELNQPGLFGGTEP